MNVNHYWPEMDEQCSQQPGLQNLKTLAHLCLCRGALGQLERK